LSTNKLVPVPETELPITAEVKDVPEIRPKGKFVKRRSASITRGRPSDASRPREGPEPLLVLSKQRGRSARLKIVAEGGRDEENQLKSRRRKAKPAAEITPKKTDITQNPVITDSGDSPPSQKPKAITDLPEIPKDSKYHLKKTAEVGESGEIPRDSKYHIKKGAEVGESGEIPKEIKRIVKKTTEIAESGEIPKDNRRNVKKTAQSVGSDPPEEHQFINLSDLKQKTGTRRRIDPSSRTGSGTSLDNVLSSTISTDVKASEARKPRRQVRKGVFRDRTTAHVVQEEPPVEVLETDKSFVLLKPPEPQSSDYSKDTSLLLSAESSSRRIVLQRVLKKNKSPSVNEDGGGEVQGDEEVGVVRKRRNSRMKVKKREVEQGVEDDEGRNEG
jgi:hypothetical protein